MPRKPVWLYFTLIAFALALDSQERPQTHLTVHLSDASGAGVPRARIGFEPSPNGPASAVESDANGVAQLDLSPGIYQLSVESPGFCFKKRPVEVNRISNQSLSAVLLVASCPGPCSGPCITVQALDPSLTKKALAVSESSILHETAEQPITIRTAHNSSPEQATRTQLERLVAAHNLRQWTFTHEVVIDEKSIPHSHPVLTLHTRHLKQDDELLSTYLHEQLHWFLTRHPEETRAAEADLRKLYPAVPTGYPEGANDIESTYLHLLVCRLEQQADLAVLGELRTAAVMQFWAGDHYRWVYRTVLQDGAKIDEILKRHDIGNPDARTDAAQ